MKNSQRGYIDWDLVWIPVAVIGLIGAVVFVVGIIGGSLDYLRCESVQEITGKPTKWALFGGCFIVHDGETIPYSRWQMLNVKIK